MDKPDPMERFVKAAREIHDRVTGGHGTYIPLRDAVEAVADLAAAWCSEEDCEHRQGFVSYADGTSNHAIQHDIGHRSELMHRCGMNFCTIPHP